MIGPKPLRKLDERLGFASAGRSALAKVFPDHWSFMLGEIAMYSFILLVITGTYLTFFFEPSSYLRVYDGSYGPEHGQLVSGAYASTVALSWDVRAGLLIRQTHHWAAHVFIGSIVLHLCRIYFTGMFRKPRELNWIVGLTLLLLGIFNAFAGYSLPDDLLSGTGLRIFEAVVISIPVVGAWLSFLIFGGEFPGHYVIERLYPIHILIVPAVIAILITVHMGILIRQKHSHFPGPGRRDSNVVGSRVWPAYALRSMALFFGVGAVVFLAGGLLQINPIWVWGDYEPQTILSPSVADWYILWIEGALRLFPNYEFTVFGHLIPNQFWPAVVMPLVLFGGLYLWPWIDRRLTGDRAPHHVAARPREAPVRVGIGVMALTFLGLLLVAGCEEVISGVTGLTIDTVRWVLRILVITLPFLFGGLAWWIARALKRSDLDHAMELGRHDLLPTRSPSPAEGEAVEEIEEEEAPANRSGIPADAADLPHQQEVN